MLNESRTRTLNLPQKHVSSMGAPLIVVLFCPKSVYLLLLLRSDKIVEKTKKKVSFMENPFGFLLCPLILF